MISVLVVCAFSFVGVPFTTVEISVEGSTPATSAIVEHYGSRMTVAVAEEQPEEGDWIHVTLDADRPGNELFMHVKSGAGQQRKARLINPAVPFAREMPGQCEISTRSRL